MTPQKLTPLNFAANMQHHYFVTKLLEVGADPTIPDAEGVLPLYRAVDLGCEEIVTTLLSNGSPTSSLERPKLPIVAAIRKNHMRILSHLIQYGAFPDRMALKLALEKSSIPALKLLLAAGVDTSQYANIKMPQKLRGILAEWDAEPVDMPAEKQSVEELQKQLESLKESCKRYIEKVRNANYKDQFLTPMIGDINDIVVSITRFVVKLESVSRNLKQERVNRVSKQLNYIETRELGELHASFRADEDEWNKIIEETKRIMSELQGSHSFSTHCIEQMKIFESKMPAVEPSLFNMSGQVLEFPVKEIRGQLLTLNQLVQQIKEYLRESHMMIEELHGFVIQSLDGIDAEISRLLETILTQQQMNFEFDELIKGLGVSHDVKVHLDERRSKLSLDKAFIAWEKKEFVQHMNRVLQLIRTCSQ